MEESVNNSAGITTEQSKGESIARGTLLLLIAQGVFLFNSVIMHILLARLLGPSLYGLWGVLSSILVWVELILAAGIPSVLTKLFTEEDYSHESIYRSSFYLQLSISIIIFAVFFLASPILGFLLKDRSLVYFLRLIFIDIPFFGMLYLFYSVLRGNKHFTKLSIGIVIYTFVKTGAIIFLVMIGLSIEGAIVGSISASIVALVVTYFMKETGGSVLHKKTITYKNILKYVPYFIVFSLTSQFITHIDLWSVKAILQDNVITGYYNAAAVISQSPGFVLLALSITLFPAVNSALSKKDFELANRYLKQAIRLTAFLSFPLYSLFVASSKPLILLVFSKKFLPAWSILNILLIGFILVTFIEILSTLMLALNDFKLLTILMLGLSLLAIGLNVLFIPQFGPEGAALATTTTLLIGIFFGIFYFKRNKMNLPVGSLLRILLASLIIFPIIKLTAGPGIMLFPSYILGGLVYMILLLLFRELTKKDLDLIKEVIGSKQSNKS